MLVTSYSGPVSGVYTATVVRGDGITVKSTHRFGAKVMSTPLPTAKSTASGPLVGVQVPVRMPSFPGG